MNDPKEDQDMIEEYSDEIIDDPWPEIDEKIDNGEEIE